MADIGRTYAVYRSWSWIAILTKKYFIQIPIIGVK